MNKAEAIRKFIELYKQADYKTRQLVDLEIGVSISKIENENQRKRAFFEAIKQRNITAVANIIKEDDLIDANIRDQKLGNTPIIHAICNNDERMVELLLRNSADPTIKNDAGYNAFDAARISKNIKIKDLMS